MHPRWLFGISEPSTLQPCVVRKPSSMDHPKDHTFFGLPGCIFVFYSVLTYKYKYHRSIYIYIFMCIYIYVYPILFPHIIYIYTYIYICIIHLYIYEVINYGDTASQPTAWFVVVLCWHVLEAFPATAGVELQRHCTRMYRASADLSDF